MDFIRIIRTLIETEFVNAIISLLQQINSNLWRIIYDKAGRRA